MTKKDRSSHISKNDFSLPRAKILRGRKNFDRLFENDAQFCRSKNINLRFKIVDDSSFGCQMAFIVKKKLGKANKRNRTKRLLKEAYRLHQHLLSAPLRKANITFHGAFMAKTVDLAFADAEQDVINLLEQIREQLPAV
ncbi:MAG TPA: ribonuclease P protein component [Balneolaceae bacterium]